ncbi:MAG: 16S rRNA (cytidine(1402)-2'-O)-methyltransferase [Hyphomicrobium sp.]|nr:16S rRNA (cytidine(1402)-2'-O)-methyltransferase [Hyphomicrobium sp.]
MGTDIHTTRFTVDRVAHELARQIAVPLEPGLYLVATPIGNLADITIRALGVLVRADIILCEDTRHSRTLLQHYGVGGALRPFHEHNEDQERPRILSALSNGKVVALISDAGTPLVSDPGYKLVREAAALGHPVVSIPGASALLAAITASGLPPDSFHFAGFLPSREVARRTRIAELADVPGTLIFYEAPTRVAEAVADLADVLGPRPAALARELTKLHEEVVRLPLDRLADQLAREPIKGEIVIVVGPPVETVVDDDRVLQELDLSAATMSLRDAARAVADKLGIPKARAYDLALKRQRERDG